MSKDVFKKCRNKDYYHLTIKMFIEQTGKQNSEMLRDICFCKIDRGSNINYRVVFLQSFLYTPRSVYFVGVPFPQSFFYLVCKIEISINRLCLAPLLLNPARTCRTRSILPALACVFRAHNF